MSPLRSTRGLATGLAVCGVLLASTLVGAATASAGETVDISVSNGTVGVSQRVTATVYSDGGVGSPAGTITFTAGGQQIGAQPVGGSLGSSAQINWSPGTAVSTNVVANFVGANGDTAGDSATVSVNQVDTSTSMTTPGSAATSSQVSIAANVRATQGGYVPTGTVTFYSNGGSVIGSSGLDGNGKATISYTVPAATGTIYLYATYNGDANAYASKRSATDSIKVTSQAASVSVVVPQTNYVNSPVQLTAKVNPASATGTVQFSVDGKYLGTSKVSGGNATLTWVPSALGTFTISAKYSGGGGVDGGTASNSVSVTMPLKPDQISLNPNGAAGVWAPGSVNTLANGATIQFNMSSAAGLPVTLTVNSPCSVSGNTLRVNGVGGPCTLVAATPGGNGFAPTTQQYTIVTGTGSQTASVLAPSSGSYKKGKLLKLSTIGTVTNLGQPVTWKVTKGASVCKVKTGGGYYKLKLVKAGKCTVIGSAPAVAGQWSNFSTSRKYSAK